MAFNINEIRSQLVLGGARPSLFQVRINNPVNGAGDLKTPFMVKASQLPASSLGLVEVPYFGEDFLIRNAMEEWSHAINSHVGNLREFGEASPSEYKTDATVTQFSKTGVPIREYKFVGIFPTDITEIPLSWESVDEIAQFDVSFQYDYWTVSGVTGNAGT